MCEHMLALLIFTFTKQLKIKVMLCFDYSVLDVFSNLDRRDQDRSSLPPARMIDTCAP